MRFAFIDAYEGPLSKRQLCRLFAVSERGLRAWRNRSPSQRQRDDMVLLAHIREQKRLSLGSYGRPRMTAELNELGFDVGERRVGRLMKENGIFAVRTKKYKRTTVTAVPIPPSCRLGDLRSARSRMNEREFLRGDYDGGSHGAACGWAQSQVAG